MFQKEDECLDVGVGDGGVLERGKGEKERKSRCLGEDRMV